MVAESLGMRSLLIVAAVAISIAGCSVRNTSVARNTPIPSTATLPIMGPWSEPACPASSATTREIQGTANSGTQIWALIIGRFPPLRAGTQAKVIIRITGVGDAVFYADGPSGAQIRPDFAPQAHGGSSWDRPGDEWGTEFTFPSAGCWNLRVVRSTGRGSIPLTVSP